MFGGCHPRVKEGSRENDPVEDTERNSYPPPLENTFKGSRENDPVEDTESSLKVHEFTVPSGVPEKTIQSRILKAFAARS